MKRTWKQSSTVSAVSVLDRTLSSHRVGNQDDRSSEGGVVDRLGVRGLV